MLPTLYFVDFSPFSLPLVTSGFFWSLNLSPFGGEPLQHSQYPRLSPLPAH